MRSWIRDIYWKLTHRYCPKHQYHEINDIGLEAGYYDPDTRILRSTFTLFCEWKESVEKTVDWRHNHTPWFYLCEAYDYWRIERPNLELEVDEHWDKCGDYKFELFSKPTPNSDLYEVSFDTTPLDEINWKLNSSKATQMEQYIQLQDKYYLKIIIDHLHHLWYP